MSAKCKQCGKCCEVLILKQTKKVLRDKSQRWNQESANFILRYWRRISRAEAVQRNSLLKQIEPGWYFYECEKFDPVSRKCLVHDNGKPPVCKKFPWYGAKPEAIRIFWLPECAYQADIQREAVELK